MDRQGIGLSMNMIVLLIFGIVAVIILGAIGYGKIRFFQSNIDSKESCISKGGDCLTQEECPTSSMLAFGCPEEQVCCLGICTNNGGQCKSKCGSDEISYAGYHCDGENLCCIQKEVS